MLHKFVAYSALWRARLHTSEFGWRNFRVLIVTGNPDRAHNMRHTLTRMSANGSPLFWFADRADLAVINLLDHTWVDGTGAARKLMPST